MLTESKAFGEFRSLRSLQPSQQSILGRCPKPRRFDLLFHPLTRTVYASACRRPPSCYAELAFVGPLPFCKSRVTSLPTGFLSVTSATFCSSEPLKCRTYPRQAKGSHLAELPAWREISSVLLLNNSVKYPPNVQGLRHFSTPCTPSEKAIVGRVPHAFASPLTAVVQLFISICWSET